MTFKLITNGDSWTFGSEIADPTLVSKYIDKKHVTEFDHFPENDNYRIPKIWPTHMANLMNAEVINLSWPADDNGSILRRTINYITNTYIAKDITLDNVFVIIGWSSPERNSFWYKDESMSGPFRLWPQNSHFDTKPQEKFWDLYTRYLWNAEEYMPRYVLDVLQFQNFCKAHNIKWMCFNSFYQTPKKSIEDWNDLDVSFELKNLENKLAGYQYQSTIDMVRRHDQIDYQSLWNTINPVRFYKKDQPRNTFKNYIENHELSTAPVFNGWHPSPASHEIWAQELANYIIDNNLLK
jgi:hypothetical protein